MDTAVRDVDSFVKEYLHFRGFTTSIVAFNADRKADRGQDFNVERLVSLFTTHVENYDLGSLLDTWEYLESRFLSQMTGEHINTMKRLGDGLRRWFVIHAAKSRKSEKVSLFFEACADRFGLLNDPTWSNWFVLPYTAAPESHPVFEPYFTGQWLDVFLTSLQNFLKTVFCHIQPPQLILYRQERIAREGLESELKAARVELSRLRAELAALGNVGMQRRATVSNPRPSYRTPSPTISTEHSPSKSMDPLGVVKGEEEELEVISFDKEEEEEEEEETDLVENGQVSLDSVLSGHTAPITRVKFSPVPDSSCLASSSMDGSVRIWEFGESKRRATILCENPVLDLDWEPRSSKLLFCSTEDGRVRMWNADAKRIVGDLEVGTSKFPRVTSICSSPFATLICGCSAPHIDDEGFIGTSRIGGSVSAWSVKTLQEIQKFKIEPNPSAVYCIALNHNGTMLYSGTSDGMIRAFDMRSASPLMGWPAHEGGVTSLSLSPDETSIYSAGADGRLIQFNIHRMGSPLRSLDLNQGSVMRLALDTDGDRAVLSGTAGAMILPLTDFSAESAVPLYAKMSMSNRSGRHVTTTSPSSICTAIDHHPSRPTVVAGYGNPGHEISIFDVNS